MLTPTCTCGTKARWVVNGPNANLQYWWCDTCKDEVTDQKTESYTITANTEQIDAIVATQNQAPGVIQMMPSWTQAPTQSPVLNAAWSRGARSQEYVDVQLYDGSRHYLTRDLVPRELTRRIDHAADFYFIVDWDKRLIHWNRKGQLGTI